VTTTASLKVKDYAKIGGPNGVPYDIAGLEPRVKNVTVTTEVLIRELNLEFSNTRQQQKQQHELWRQI